MGTDASTTVQTPASLRALLTDLIDYAGLFPPAALSLDEAFPNYLKYRESNDAWMLNHFIIPGSRLADLKPYAGELEDGEPCTLSILGPRAAGANAFVEGVGELLHRLANLSRETAGKFEGHVIEAPVPTEVLSLGASQLRPVLEHMLVDLQNVLTASPVDEIMLFLEVPFAHSATTMDSVAQCIAAYNKHSDGGLRTGYKMRTGSTNPTEIPPSSAVASALVACHSAGVPYKATAGLHHPVRHYNEALGGYMHGFFNLFGAAAILSGDELSMDAVTELLEEENSNAFSFDDEGLTWSDHRISVSEIKEMRSGRAISFGSCSFDEPREDLRSLGLL